MQILKDRIRKDGKIKAGNVLKVDSFLNHQMDIKLFGEIGREFKRPLLCRTDYSKYCRNLLQLGSGNRQHCAELQGCLPQ